MFYLGKSLNYLERNFNLTSIFFSFFNFNDTTTFLSHYMIFGIYTTVQWGPPTFSVSSILGMLTGVLACTVESLSYYPSVARMCSKF